MDLGATSRRRWFGVGLLLAAILMLAAGQTVLQGHLSDSAFLVYWLVCLALTALAALTACRDVRAVRRRTREEARDLLQSTLQDIERDASARSRRPGAE